MYSGKKSEDIWLVVCVVAAIVAAIAFTPQLSAQLGWSGAITFLVILVDVALVVHLPITLPFLYSVYRLTQSDFGRDISHEGPLSLALYTLFYLVIPVLVFLWLASNILAR